MTVPSHVRTWARLLETNRRLVVEAARDHGKSWCFSYAWPIFNLQREAGCQVALVSYAEDQARKNLARARLRLEADPDLRWLLPRSKAQVWDAGRLDCANGSSLEAFGFGSSVRGGHYHLVVVDDPCKDQGTMSLSEQENFLFGVLEPATRRGGQLVVCGNPVAKQDLLARLEDGRQYPLFRFPALDESGVPLWPEQYSASDLEERRRRTPAYIYVREYLLQRVNPERAPFTEDMIIWYRAEELPAPLRVIMTVDPTASPGGDPLAAVVTGTAADGVSYVLDRLRHRGDLEQGIELLVDLANKHGPDLLGIETFASQKMYRLWLEKALDRRGLRIPIVEMGRDSTRSKAMRIQALQPKLKQHQLRFLPEHRPLVDQLLTWDPLSRTQEDDEIDALAWQVPLWEDPVPEAIPAVARAGTFGEAMEELRLDRRRGYLDHLFGEHLH